MSEIFLIRHAPINHGGRLIGRTDLGANLPQDHVFAEFAGLTGTADARLTSPALRCRQTAVWLDPRASFTEEPLLWEQDFGAWEGKPYAEVPDLGTLAPEQIAQHRPPQGESFLDLVDRLRQLLPQLRSHKRVVIVAHAGIIRAALGLALGAVERGLSFRIDPLSVTKLQIFESGWAIEAVNRHLTKGILL